MDSFAIHSLTLSSMHSFIHLANNDQYLELWCMYRLRIQTVKKKNAAVPSNEIDNYCHLMRTPRSVYLVRLCQAHFDNSSFVC